MGYETKLIIGKIYLDNMGNSYHGNKGKMVGDIAMIELSGSVFTSTRIDDNDTQEAFVYLNGDKEVSTDKYGHQLYAINPKKVLDIMIAENRKEKYRRYSAAIPMLASLIKSFKNENLVCVLYGY